MKCASISPIAFVSVAVSSFGCSMQRNPLEPAVAEESAVGPGDAISETDAGVEVVAAVDAWNGRPSVLDDVTPVHLRIDNGSGHPLRVQLGDMRLRDASGRTYAALPLYDVDGETTIALQGAYEPVPRFTYDGFHVTEPYADLYPGVGVYEGPVAYDDGYYDYGYYYDAWATIPLPTALMVDLAIPEGVVEPDGWVRGFVYFERVQPRSTRADLEYDLVDVETGQRFGQATLTFAVVP